MEKIQEGSEYYKFAQLMMYLQYIKNAAYDGFVKLPDHIFDAVDKSIKILLSLDIKELNEIEYELVKWRTHFKMNYKGKQRIGSGDSKILITSSKQWRDNLLGFLRYYKPDKKPVFEEKIPVDKIFNSIETMKNQVSEYLKNTNVEQLDLKDKLEKIEKIISSGQKTSINFLINSVEKKDIKTKISTMIRSADKGDNILICSPYLGTALSDVMIEAIERGANIRLLCRPLNQPNREAKLGFKNLSKRLKDNMRTKNELHARLYLLEDKEGLITSADLDSASLDTNYNAGIWTNNMTILTEVKEFFETIWTESGQVIEK